MSTDKGAFVVFCGLDASGKSHQADLLAEHVRQVGLSPLITGQPTSWYKESSLARDYFRTLQADRLQLGALALLSAADRLRHIHDVVIPARRSGKIVICTRYYLSAYAYFLERGVDDLYWLRDINRYAPPPDITILLDIPGAIAQQRLRTRDGTLRLEEEQVDRLERIRQRFLTFDEAACHVIDATAPPEAIHRRVVELLAPILHRERGSE